MKVLAYLNTYKRYDTTLPMALLSLINQTHKPDKIIVFDDNPDHIDPNQVEHYRYLMGLCWEKGIEFWWDYAGCKGAHHNHERANMMGYDYAWFIDDDNIAEPTCLENLLKEMKSDVGAVGGLILKPGAQQLPNTAKNVISDLYAPNIQWFHWTGKPREVEHIYSGFLYRCGIVHHDLRLTKKVFRGETMFTHSLFLKGYKLIVTPNAVTWHFENSTGGCRTKEEEQSTQAMYDKDQGIFNGWLAFQKMNKKLYVIDGGLGDHYMFRQAIEPEPGSILAVCYPEVFSDRTDCEIISIAQAEQYVDRRVYDIYNNAEMYGIKGHPIELYKKLYENINHTRK